MQGKVRVFVVILAVLAVAAVSWGLYSYLQVNALQAQVNDANASSEKARGQIEELTAAADNAQTALDEMNAEIEKMNEGIEAAKAQVTALEDEKINMTRDIIAANDELSEKKELADQLLSDIAKRDGEISTLYQDIENYQAQIEELKAQGVEPSQEPTVN